MGAGGKVRQRRLAQSILGHMAKRSAAAEHPSRPWEQQQEATARPWVKALLSALIAFHITAVFVGPFAFASNWESPFAEAVSGAIRWYTGGMYLNHGYFFFAPDPGPSHLIDYQVEFDDGRPPVKGRFPDLKTERPRLLYHRHFMLAESLNNRFVPAEPPPEPSPPSLTATTEEKILAQASREQYDRQLAAWQHARKQYEAMRRSFEEHLKAKYGGDRVTLTRVEHRLPIADEVELVGRKLNAPDSYVNLPENPPRPSSR